MSIELHADAGTSCRGAAPGAGEPRDAGRPNLSGDLPTLFQAAPMFRRALAGYDRFQVDTYAQWAEHELATAERERERLLARHLSTQAALDEARELLAHSSSGGEFLRVSQRIGSMLAAATDEAENIRAEAEADRSAAALQAAEAAAAADRMLADAGAEADRVAAGAAAAAQRVVTDAETSAAGIVDAAERAAAELRAEAEARLEQVRLVELRTAEHVEQLRLRAANELSATRLQARADVVGMLDVARQQRLRADAEAAATRERLDRDAEARSAHLRAEVAALERRRKALRTEVRRLDERATPAPHRPLHPLLDRFRVGILRSS